jgi:hypothetical protein
VLVRHGAPGRSTLGRVGQRLGDGLGPAGEHRELEGFQHVWVDTSAGELVASDDVRGVRKPWAVT